MYYVHTEKPAEFVVRLRDQSVMETETAEFVVELDRPNVQVKWMKNGSELLEDERVKFVYEGNTYKVIIPDANKSDIEQYICILPDGQKSKAMLAVTGE